MDGEPVSDDDKLAEDDVCGEMELDAVPVLDEDWETLRESLSETRAVFVGSEEAEEEADAQDDKDDVSPGLYVEPDEPDAAALAMERLDEDA